MLQNVYFLAKIGADTAGNDQHFADRGRVPIRAGWDARRRPAEGPAVLHGVLPGPRRGAP